MAKKKDPIYELKVDEAFSREVTLATRILFDVQWRYPKAKPVVKKICKDLQKLIKICMEGV